MRAVEYINQLSSSLIALIAVGGAFSALVQALKMITADDESDMIRAKKNIKKIILAVVAGLSITGLIKTMFSILG